LAELVLENTSLSVIGEQKASRRKSRIENLWLQIIVSTAKEQLFHH